MASGRITLRTDPEIHKQLAKTARVLGLDLNALLNLLIRQGLPRLTLEALLYKEAMKEDRVLPLYRAWKQAFPDRKPKEFEEELRKHLMKEPSLLDGLPPDTDD